MTDSDTAGGGLHEIHVVGLPLQVQARAEEQHAELMREFALLELAGAGRPGRATVPLRLAQLIDDLVHRYGGLSDAPEEDRDAARARGDVTVDLVYHLPGSVAPACDQLLALLDEADDFCRQGEQLLTLAADDELVAYRHWYLGEFSRQIGGESPTTWAAYVAAHDVLPPGAGPK